MTRDREQFVHDLLSGRDRRARAVLLRALLAAAEPPYALLMRLRNRLYDRGLLRAHPLGRPTISVGNLTTGGTGKTPMVLWLVHRLREHGRHPAILLRGYRRPGESISDEAVMLDALLNDDRTPSDQHGTPPPIRGGTGFQPVIQPDTPLPPTNRPDTPLPPAIQNDTPSPIRGGTGFQPVIPTPTPPITSHSPPSSPLASNPKPPSRTPIQPNPDRLAGARAALQSDPHIDCFILDDAFQHRRAARDFDLLLINAADPFGFGHILPRGLLREPLTALRRADAIVLTRTDRVSESALSDIERTIRRHNPSVPIYHAVHALTGLRRGGELLPLDDLRRQRTFFFAGIASPEPLARQLADLTALAGHRWFPDHHAYRSADLASLLDAARNANAPMLLTTEKDWAKLSRLPDLPPGLPLYRLQMTLRLPSPHDLLLLEQILAASF